MSQVIARCLRLDTATFRAHTPQGVVHQHLLGDVGVDHLTEVTVLYSQEGLALRLAKRPGFLGLHQVAIDHVLNRVPTPISPLDRAWLCQLSLSSLRPGLSSLLAGECLGLLVD